MPRSDTPVRAPAHRQPSLAPLWDAVAAAADTLRAPQILARVPLPEPCGRCGGTVERVEQYVEPGRGYLATITCSECGRSRVL